MKIILYADDIIRLIEQFKPDLNLADDENFRRMRKELSEIIKRTEGIVDLEKRVSRVLKDLDINNLIKQVKSKANQDDVSKDHVILENKMNQLTEQIKYLKKDLEQITANMKKNVTNNIQFNTNLDSFNTILSTKKIVPIQCLSCGNYGNPNANKVIIII